MSYCIIGNESDVYVYGDEDHLVCAGHITQFRTGSYQEMIRHLKEHQEKGEIVPDRCFDVLQKERLIKGDIY